MAEINRQVVLAAHPRGMPGETDFRLVETPMPTPGPDQALVRAI